MLRAVEILARMHERARRAPNTPPPLLDRPVLLQSERITFTLGTTRREAVERELGIAFSYPVRGWHTYASRERTGTALLSLFYKDAVLVAAELYVPRGNLTPQLAPRDFGGFRLEPGSVTLGTHADAVSPVFTPASGGPGTVVYDRAFEARFDGGVAYAMARKGVIERLALYSAPASAGG